MDWQPIIEQTVAYVAPIAGSLIVAQVGLGLKRFSAWMSARLQSERLQSAILQVSEATVSAVADLEKSMRPYLSDGKLTLDEQRQIKEAAVNRINTHVPNAIKVLTEAGMRDLDAYISGKIEAEVMRLPPSDIKAPPLADGNLTLFEDGPQGETLR